MRKFILLLFLSCHWIIVSGQKNDAMWLFGSNLFSSTDPRWGPSVLDFHSDPPIAYEQERPMNLDVTVASICDSTGNLLFYTNGAWIANFTHEMMENGDSLNPGQITWNNYNSGLRALQSAIALPLPSNPGKFFLFHLKLDYDDVVTLARNTFYYSFIDMNENNGLGKVIQKNQELLTDERLGTLSAVKHANGRDWWVVVSDAFHYKYKKFLLSPIGASYVEEQDFGPTPERVHGSLSFSNDGTKMAQYEVPLDNVVIYDFDRCTGEISNPVEVSLPDVELGAGQAFSPNGRFFYVASSTFILQLDLWAPDIGASLDTVAVYDGFTDPSTGGLSTTFFAMQNGPDGRIYFNTNNGTMYLHYIQYPNKKGDSCQVVQHGVKLPFFNIFTSPHFPNYRLGPLDGSPCDTLGLDNHPLAGFRWEADTLNPLLVEFTDNSFYEPTNWLWDFGDGAGSAEVNPLHEYSGPGIYTVCLTVSNQYDSDTACREVEVVATGTEEVVRPGLGVEVYPNPAKRQLTIQLDQASVTSLEVRLLNLYGQTMTSVQLPEQVRTQVLNLPEMPNGIYWLIIYSGDGQKEVKRVVINR
jgi:PKD domain-containing protein/type IX secretion system substrate protein